MSSHKIQYRIYPDYKSDGKTDAEWEKADSYINGIAYSFDRGEAFSIARKAAKSCQYPFVVLAVQLPKKNDMYDAWVVYA